MHDPENGHKCQNCGRPMHCSIEDGYCDYGEIPYCDRCLRQRYIEEAYRYDVEPEDFEPAYFEANYR